MNRGIIIEPGWLRVRFEHTGKLRELVVPLTAREMRALAKCLIEAAEHCVEQGPPAQIVDLRAEAARRAIGN